MVGGFPARTRSLYLAADGVWQGADFANDGSLHSLQTTSGQGAVFDGLAEELALLAKEVERADRREQGDSEKVEPLPEYHPALHFVALRRAGRPTLLMSFSKAESPPVFDALWEALAGIGEASSSAADPGLYLKADRLPVGRSPDFTISSEESGADPRLHRILADEHRFHPSDPAGFQRFDRSASSLVERPLIIHSEDRSATYLLGAFILDPP